MKNVDTICEEGNEKDTPKNCKKTEYSPVKTIKNIKILADQDELHILTTSNL